MRRARGGSPSIAREAFSSLEVPNYRLYFAGQSTSLVGTWMQQTTQAWVVLGLTHSAADLGLTVAFQRLPVLFLGPYGGVVADRVDKRRVMVALQSVMGLQAVTLGLLSTFGVIRFWQICVLALLLGVNSSFENPCRQSFIREIVGEQHMRNAITLSGVMQSVAQSVGPAVAGVLIATIGESICFYVNAGSFVAVVTSLLVMDRSALFPAVATARGKGQLRAGLAYARRTPDIAIPLVMMACMGMFAYQSQVTLPTLAKITFHGSSESYGFMTAFNGAGAFIGGLFTAARGRTGVRWMVVAASGFGLASILVGLAPRLALAYVALLFLGWSSVSFIAFGNSTIQSSAEPGMRGRAMGLWQVAFQGTGPIGGPLMGWIIVATDPRVGLVVGGLAAFGVAIGGALLARRARRRVRLPSGEAALLT